MDENKVRGILFKIIETIPDFIDVKEETNYIVYNNIVNIIKLYNMCIINKFLSANKIMDYNTLYYAYLLTIWNTNSDLYEISYKYLNELYEKTMTILNESELYESSSNLFHLLNPEEDKINKK